MKHNPEHKQARQMKEALLGELYEEREAWKEFAKQLDVEIAEAQRIAEDFQNLAREQRKAADEVEEAMLDIDAFLAKTDRPKRRLVEP